ncbi:MAG: AraC family transcriptional regulator [Marivirga sp.]|jgi:AraC family transcriptional regulator
MNQGHMLQSIALNNEKTLHSLVENQTTYTFNQCELHVFETHQEAHQVGLLFNDFVYTSMLKGKKIMHLKDKPSFDYLPGESVIVGPNELMEIDFPNANSAYPTQCLALGISGSLIENTLGLLNEDYAKVLPEESWLINEDIHHIINNNDLNQTINRIINISLNDRGKHKDILIELALKEMIIRLMQTQARHVFDKSYESLSKSHPLAYAIAIIKNRLAEKIDFNKLAKASCMSRSTFFKKFKETFGYTPSQYVIKERLKLAKKILLKCNSTVTQACFSCGFENLSHFTTAFTRENQLTPSQFKRASQSSQYNTK